MDVFDEITGWLAEEALTENPIARTIEELALRLREGGVPVGRIICGRILLHPAIGMFDIGWNADTGLVQTNLVSRSDVRAAISMRTPFGDIALGQIPRLCADLDDDAIRQTYPVLEQLHKGGFRGYAAFGRNFGLKQKIFDGVREDFRGTSVSFATRRSGGFTDDELEGLERLTTPLAVAIRVDTVRFLTTELLAHYLGRETGQKVLSGQSARGDGSLIDCVLFFSDMRGSLHLADTLEASEYLAVVNSFFDCTAGADLDHGGEVLKFMGDGILAIFPVVDGRRTKDAMCRAAMSAARDALRRGAVCNDTRRENVPDIDFGIALHVGQVIYGNVGTINRHDFTATGRAVGQAARIEAMTRELGFPILTSAEFAETLQEKGTPFARQTLRGLGEPMDIIGFSA